MFELPKTKLNIIKEKLSKMQINDNNSAQVSRVASFACNDCSGWCSNSCSSCCTDSCAGSCSDGLG